jgi:hypothetical protein
MAKLVDLDGRWSNAIGRAFVAFGHIESIVDDCLDKVPRDNIRRFVSRLPLFPRIELLLEIMEGHPAEILCRLSTQLKAVKELTKTRNLIAHNPLALSFFVGDDGEFTHRETIVPMRQGIAEVDIQQLEHFAKEAEKITSELHLTLSFLDTWARSGKPGQG